jgi:hypothetical protein
MLNYLRITASVVFLVISLLLIGLWVRSYWWWDYAGWGVTTKQGFIVYSQSGATLLEYRDFRGWAATLMKWKVGSMPSPDTNLLPIGGIENTFAGFFLHHAGWGSSFLLGIPYWFLVPFAGAFAAAPGYVGRGCGDSAFAHC